MRMSDIINLLKEYLVLGIIALIFLGILFFIGYKVIYKKKMKGTKTINKKQLILYGISICYIIVMLGAVFLNRSGVYGTANLHLFSSYIQAYNEMDMSLFRNIILNILLFVPLGFLLPIYTDKLKKIYKVVPIGFAVTLAIEIIQYITQMGIFEIDDVFNNTLGVLIGYSIFMIYDSLKNKMDRKKILIYALPTIITICAFLGIYIKYQNQELGNLYFKYNYKINMKNAKVESNIELSEQRENLDIFYTKILTEEETKKIATSIFEKIGTHISEDDTDLYENTAMYYSSGRNNNVSVKYNGGTYSYTDYSKFTDDGIMPQKTGATRDKIELALQQFDIKIPENAEFKEESNGDYSFTINMHLEENGLTDGNLRCSYYQDGTIKSIHNNLVKYEKVKNKEIISPKEAYNEILEGKFKYGEYYLDKIENVVIENVNIKYTLDSKGFYVPVYVFESKINNIDYDIYIEAIK